ncbi:uncharacterized protein [Dermacentor albipictus]|uniref:uncharacterized protein n=1 Tax=Dermacentor albipictus TaxID=60249 RepID=UPI0031FBF175
MCFTNTPGTIKALAAFCFCINMFNLVYLFMRYQELLPAQAQQLRIQVESVMPDVKNLDKYMARRNGVIFVSMFAAISVLFDYVLYVGVDSQKPRLILCAWTWGIIDSSFDAAIGIASGNLSFMDGLARTPAPIEVTVLTEKPLYHVYGKSVQRLDAAPELRSPFTPATPAEKGPHDNETESSVRAPREQVSDYQSTIVDHEAYRLTEEQSTVLLLYVLLRLIFKVVALSGIKDFASRVAIECEKRKLALQLGHEAETVSLEEPDVPGPPQSKRKIAMPPQDMPAPRPPPPPVVPPFIPGMPGIPFPPPPGFIAQPLPGGRGPPPPPGMLGGPEIRSPAPPGFLFPPPSVVPYPTVDPTAFGNRPQ